MKRIFFILIMCLCITPVWAGGLGVPGVISGGSGGTTYTAGNGLTLTGTSFSAKASTSATAYVTVGAGGISVQASTLQTAIRTAIADESGVSVIGTTYLATAGTHPLGKARATMTVTAVHCITDTGTVIVDLQEGSSTAYTSGTDVSTSPITCDSNGAAAVTISNATIDANDWMALRIGTDASTPTKLNVTWFFTVDR